MQEDKIREQEKDKLFEAILSLESVEECRRFFVICVRSTRFMRGRAFGGCGFAEGRGNI